MAPRPTEPGDLQVKLHVKKKFECDIHSAQFTYVFIPKIKSLVIFSLLTENWRSKLGWYFEVFGALFLSPSMKTKVIFQKKVIPDHDAATTIVCGRYVPLLVSTVWQWNFEKELIVALSAAKLHMMGILVEFPTSKVKKREGTINLLTNRQTATSFRMKHRKHFLSKLKLTDFE